MSDRREAIRRAHELSQNGQTEQAVRVLVEADVVDEAARMLAAEWRHTEAGQLLLDHVGGVDTDFDKLDPEKRKLAMLAAHYFVKGRDNATAVDIYLSLGEQTRAADLLEKSGDTQGAEVVRRQSNASAQLGPKRETGKSQAFLRARELERAGKTAEALAQFAGAREWAEAGRLSRKLGNLEDAARYYALGDLNFEAAICFLDAGEIASCLDSLVRVPSDDDRYRAACNQAIRTVVEHDMLTINVDTFLSEFIRTGPTDELEAEQFVALGGVYEAHDFPANAREVYKKVVVFDPTNVEAGKKLIAVDRLLSGEARQLEKILEQDESFKRETDTKLEEADLPDLPDLPPLPGQAPEPVVVTPRDLFQEGGRIADRYVVEEIIGQGGMALVVRAYDEELEETVAMKLLQEQSFSEETQDRFKRELKLSRKLSHPNIIRVHDIGVFHGHRYITMEFLEGDTLEDQIGIPFEYVRGVDLIKQACVGLQVAHDAGVVHRDVKPGNFFITKNDTLKIMDFGMARQMDLPSGITRQGTVAGTPNYMSPEQINRPNDVTLSADLYSLGIVMYEMFTGELPFFDAELMPLLMMHATKTPPHPRDHNPLIPDALSEVILKLMEKEPENRYASARKLAARLDEIRLELESQA